MATEPRGNNRPAPSLKPKDLVGIPWRVAFALQADGWWLRSDIIWNKPNCMPESVTDRPTRAHEYVFLLSKSARYFYDADAVREPTTSNPDDGRRGDGGSYAFKPTVPVTHMGVPEAGRNRRTVWTIPTHAYKEAHFAVFPPALVEPMIRAGTSERGVCPECGAPWERVVEKTTRFEGGSGKAGRSAEDANASGKWAGKQHGENIKLGPVVSTNTIGWRPTCACEKESQNGTLARLGSCREMGRNNRPVQMQNMREDSEKRGFSRHLQPIPATVLDPFGGAGTVGLVADRLGRDAILMDLSADYCEMARTRIEGDAPMFVDVSMEMS